MIECKVKINMEGKVHEERHGVKDGGGVERRGRELGKRRSKIN